MILISIFGWGYKPTYNWRAPSCSVSYSSQGGRSALGDFLEAIWGPHPYNSQVSVCSIHHAELVGGLE